MRPSEVALLGEGIISLSDWFRGKTWRPKMASMTIFRGFLCVYPLETVIVDAEKMAAIEMKGMQ